MANIFLETSVGCPRLHSLNFSGLGEIFSGNGKIFSDHGKISFVHGKISSGHGKMQGAFLCRKMGSLCWWSSSGERKTPPVLHGWFDCGDWNSLTEKCSEQTDRVKRSTTRKVALERTAEWKTHTRCLWRLRSAIVGVFRSYSTQTNERSTRKKVFRKFSWIGNLCKNLSERENTQWD